MLKGFWEEIGSMNEVNDINMGNLSMNAREMEKLDSKITRIQVEYVLKYLKIDQAAGLDGILCEMYKWGGARMVDLLVFLFNRILKGDRVPMYLNESSDFGA